MVLTARANTEGAPSCFEVDLGNLLVKLMLCNPAKGTEAATVERWCRALLDQEVITHENSAMGHKAKFWKTGAGSSRGSLGEISIPSFMTGSYRGSSKHLVK